ncbi:MAG: hypothetical protein QXG71_01780 [Nanopusillaceae archaeon]
MNEKFKKITYTYIKYLFGNFTKMLLYYTIVLYIYLESKINFLHSIQKIFIFYLGYMSIYFFNDYIDRERDLKRKIIHPNKLILSKNELLAFGIIHSIISLTILSLLKDIIGVILTLINISIGIFRSFFHNRNLREFSLIFLSFFKLYATYYFVYNSFILNSTIILFFVYISIIYSAFYYFHKYYNEFDIVRKILYYTIYPLLSLITAFYLYRDFQNLFLSTFTIAYFIILLLYLRSYKRLIKDNNRNFVKLLNIAFTIIFFLILIFILLKAFLFN